MEGVVYSPFTHIERIRLLHLFFSVQPKNLKKINGFDIVDKNTYPWGGDFTVGSPDGCVAVVLLTTSYKPSNVAIYGPLRTENIGIEKVVANVISNPRIRYLIVCGEEIRGHRSGGSLIALHKNGIDENKRIVDAPGAIPYIENLKEEAIKRFQQQIEIIDLIGEDNEKIDRIIREYTSKSPPPFGEPYIAIRIKTATKMSLEDKRALHSKIIVDYLGRIEKRGK
jgi:tetrahydromethanopterin S-methyltransferase subunit A